ncbi:MAG: FHA domain-containing protein [Phycisphaerae bacterium]
MDAKLVMFKANGQRKDFRVKTPKMIVGRGEDADLRIPIMSVSRHHTELRTEDSTLVAKDLGSSNGTYVNNKRVNEQVLSAGDRLVIGPVVFTLQIDGKPSEIKPVKTRGQRMAEAGEPGMNEVVDLEADVTGPGGGASEVEPVELAEDQDVDPIAALEALAAEQDEDKNQ